LQFEESKRFHGTQKRHAEITLPLSKRKVFVTNARESDVTSDTSLFKDLFVVFRLSCREQKSTTKASKTKRASHVYIYTSAASAHISMCNLSIMFILKMESLDSNKDKFCVTADVVLNVASYIY